MGRDSAQHQAIFWDRGRPARNEREARNLVLASCERLHAFRRVCGRGARGPSKSLECLRESLVEGAIAVNNYGGPTVSAGPPREGM